MPQHIVHTIMRDIYLTVMLVRQEDTMRGIHLTVMLVKQEDTMLGLHLTVVLVKQEDTMQHITLVTTIIVHDIVVILALPIPVVGIATMRHTTNVHHTQCTMRHIINVHHTQYIIQNIINVHHTQYIIQHPQHILLQDIVLLLMVQKHTVHILNPTNNMQQCIKKLVEEQFQKIHA